jgi:hypothetical protein
VKLDRLDEIEREVYSEVDRMCLRVGALLHEARQLAGRQFPSWVEHNMPFGIDKARRLIAIHLAYSELPEETVAQLPRPWQALYALRARAPQMPELIASGEVSTEMTVVQSRVLARRWSSNTPPATDEPRGYRPGGSRFRTADTRAGDLMNHSPDDLSAPVRESLVRWLSRAEDGTGEAAQ